MFEPYHPHITKIYMRIHNGLNIILSRFDIAITCIEYKIVQHMCITVKAAAAELAVS
jgi:hypothetical protein